MRLVASLLESIDKSFLIDYYFSMSSYAVIHGAKLPSLDEFMNTVSNNSKTKTSQFDEKTDKFLEEQAKKLLEQRRTKRG